MTEPHRPQANRSPGDPRTPVPHGAWAGGHQPIAPSAGHGAVLVASIAIAAALIAGGPALSDFALITLLVLLLGCGALVVPVAVTVAIWPQARPPIRALLALAGLACLLVLALGVVRIAAVVPVLL
jgi:hypothetical protein